MVWKSIQFATFNQSPALRLAYVNFRNAIIVIIIASVPWSPRMEPVNMAYLLGLVMNDII